MKILYLPCHKRLRADETLLLRELGHEVLMGLDHINDEYDAAIVVHKPVYYQYFNKLLSRKIPVYYRTIGQCTAGTEQDIQQMRKMGIKIIRYSATESYLPCYGGHDYLVKFHKDQDIWKGWTGEDVQVCGFGKKVLERKDFLSYDIWKDVTRGFNRKWFGTHNDNLDVPHEAIPEDNLISTLARQRCVVYTGTWPAPYTLGFIELMMMGVPMICIGENLWYNKSNFLKGLYAIPRIINDGIEGYVSNSTSEIRQAIDNLLYDHELAKVISQNGRERAIELFGKEVVKEQWRIALALETNTKVSLC